MIHGAHSSRLCHLWPAHSHPNVPPTVDLDSYRHIVLACFPLLYILSCEHLHQLVSSGAAETPGSAESSAGESRGGTIWKFSPGNPGRKQSGTVMTFCFDQRDLL